MGDTPPSIAEAIEESVRQGLELCSHKFYFSLSIDLIHWF
jgi:hypothetical protein